MIQATGAQGGVTPRDPIAGSQACPSAASALSASDGWTSTLATQSSVDELHFEIMARPGAANLNGFVAIGGQDVQHLSDAAIAVRFAENGLIDARNGSRFDSDSIFEYEWATGTASSSRPISRLRRTTSTWADAVNRKSHLFVVHYLERTRPSATN